MRKFNGKKDRDQYFGKSEEEIERLFWEKEIFHQRRYYVIEEEDSPYHYSCNSKFFINLKTINQHFLDKLINSAPGITKPYTYIGNIGTSFPWHREDMNLGSISYLGKGSPKIWYVIKPRDRDCFEKEIVTQSSSQEYVCELHAKNRLIDPINLTKFDYQKVVQRVGDYVIVFPGAYHSGINIGKNIATSINYASTAWAADKYMFCNCYRLVGKPLNENELEKATSEFKKFLIQTKKNNYNDILSDNEAVHDPDLESHLQINFEYEYENSDVESTDNELKKNEKKEIILLCEETMLPDEKQNTTEPHTKTQINPEPDTKKFNQFAPTSPPPSSKINQQKESESVIPKTIIEKIICSPKIEKMNPFTYALKTIFQVIQNLTDFQPIHSYSNIFKDTFRQLDIQLDINSLNKKRKLLNSNTNKYLQLDIIKNCILILKKNPPPDKELYVNILCSEMG